ncbi:hypothetical protein TNCV_2558201 [Trichonephila clavipes]|nr:hypothetical protein TNCV_2558201 [Trichonephila clavipes]
MQHRFITLFSWMWQAKGYGHVLVVGMSLVLTLMPQKIHCVKEVMHVKSIEAPIPPFGVVWKFGEENFNLRCCPGLLTGDQKYEVRRQHLSCCFIVRRQ